MKNKLFLIPLLLIASSHAYSAPELNDNIFEKTKILAQHGNIKAQNQLGIMYFNGTESKQDYVQAMEWIQKAAEQGYDVAQNNLGVIYFQGLGTQKDYTLALKWLQNIANNNIANAQFNLALMYLDGLGIEQNHQEALQWFQKVEQQKAH
ncbi:TPA: tetratricopeptide repeat protein [Providencia rettgeri]